VDVMMANRVQVPELLLLEAMRAALTVNEPQLAEAWSSQLPVDLSPVEECMRLRLHAAILKDLHQHNALSAIIECFTRAKEVLRTAVGDDVAACERELAEIAVDSLPSALFLQGIDAKTAAASVEPLLPALDSDARANVLSTLAEREMKSPHVDWKEVARWVTSAEQASQASNDLRSKAYATYQQAQYLRQRPSPRLADAHERYTASRTHAMQAGEKARVGLALYRLIQLEATDHALRQGKGRDALSLRALARLQYQTAKLSSDPIERRARLLEAVSSLADPALSGKGDTRLLSTVCVDALELRATGDFIFAQKVLGTVGAEIARRLEIVVDIDQPEGVRTAIQSRLETIA
jgi:hypothetical protein